MEPGKIYFLSYGGTEIVGRYKGSDVCNHYFVDLLHYWAGYESYRHGGNDFCVKSGLKQIRTATQAEKWSLLRFSVEHNMI